MKFIIKSQSTPAAHRKLYNTQHGPIPFFEEQWMEFDENKTSGALLINIRCWAAYLIIT